MEQRDIIKDQIEQLGKVLGKILTKFMGLPIVENTNEVIEMTNQELQTELDLDINQLIQLESPELERYVQSLKLTDKHLDQLSNYLFKVGIYNKKDDENNGDSQKYFKSAKNLLELANEKSNTITFDRINLKGKIKNELQ